LLLLVSRKSIFITALQFIEQAHAILWLGYETHTILQSSTTAFLTALPCTSQAFSSYGGCLHCCIYGLYSDAVSSSKYIEWLVNNCWKGCSRKWLWYHFKYYLSICQQEVTKITNNFGQRSQCSVKIQTNYLSNTHQKHNRLSQLAL
jgi:hypothetical protein